MSTPLAITRLKIQPSSPASVTADQHTATARHQIAYNALSTASWHLAQGRTEQALGRILSAARQLKQACTEAATIERA